MSSASHCGADALSTARSLSSSSSARASAVPCYWSALSTTPTAPVAYELASLAYSLGDTSSVERSLSLAVRVDPSFGEGYFELGNVYFDQRRHAEAAHTFRASLAARKPPRDLPMVHNNLANVLSEVGDREGAAREYEAGLRIAPTFPYLLNGAANLQAESGQLAEAASTLGTLLEAHPDAHYARHNRGIFLRGLKRWDEAESELRAALAAKPIEPRYHQGLGVLLHTRARRQEAMKSYRQRAPQKAPLKTQKAPHTPICDPAVNLPCEMARSAVISSDLR